MKYVKVFKVVQCEDLMSHVKIAEPKPLDWEQRLYFNSALKVEHQYNEYDYKFGKWDDIVFEIDGDNDLGYTDFLYFNQGIIIFSENIFNNYSLNECFYYSGEIIEILVKNSPIKYYISNVTYAINCLDKPKCVFGTKDENGQCDITKYEFRPDRTFSQKPLFKLEPDWDRCIYTLQASKFSGDIDFIRRMKKFKIDIFKFEMLYRKKV